MKKLFVVLLSLLFVFGILTGCGEDTSKPEKEKTAGEKTEQTEKAAFPVTIKDALDNEVVIDAKPERIVSLIPSNTETAFALGLGDEIVGVSEFDNYPEEVTEKEKIGGMEFNVEKVISLDPDLVLAHESSAAGSKEGLQQLRDSGIKVIVINNAENFEQAYESILMIGKASGKGKEAQEIVDGMKEKVAEIKSKASKITEKKKVYLEVSPAPEIFTTGKNTFMDEMVTLLNAENVAGDQEGWIMVDQEAIIKKNPDVIITTYGYYTEDPVGQVTSRDGWKDVNAVKNQQVFDVHSDLVTRPGPRLVEGVEELAKAIYPDIFNK